MASDMLVALGRTTPDGLTLFAHNVNSPHGETIALSLLPGADHAPGETAPGSKHGVPEIRRTWAALVAQPSTAAASPAPAGCYCGVNEKGVAIGCTTIATRLLGEGEMLTGPELVRLGLQRAASAYQAVEVITDLIARHGQGGGSTARTLDAALLVADATEAYVIEAVGAYWVMAQIGSVRAVTPACMIHKDWDRIARGLSDLAISRGWWPADGCKLDFAAAFGRVGPDNAEALQRWGRATMTLEHSSGEIDVPLVRRVLRDQAELVAPADAPPTDRRTIASFLVRLGPEPNDLPTCWIAFGSPAASVYLPAFPCAELPEAYGGRLAYELGHIADQARTQPRAAAALRSALADLQERLDDHVHDFVSDARALYRRGLTDELRRLAGSFMQHAAERTEEALEAMRPRGGRNAPRTEEVLQGADF